MVSADLFFQRDGQYQFDPTRLGEAHAYCMDAFKTCIDLNVDVIVDNTNLSKREYQKYVDYARLHGYNVFTLTVDSLHTDEQLAERNIHGVPVESIKRMRERMHS